MSDLDLLKARAEAAGVIKVYKFGEVPSNPGSPYAVLSLDTGAPGAPRTGGADGTWFRLAAQVFSRTDDGLRDVARLLDVAFRNVTLTDLTGDPFCRREMASPLVSRDADAGGFLGLIHTYRY